MLRLIGLVLAVAVWATACSGGDDVDLTSIDDEQEIESGDLESPEIGPELPDDDDDGDVELDTNGDADSIDETDPDTDPANDTDSGAAVADEPRDPTEGSEAEVLVPSDDGDGDGEPSTSTPAPGPDPDDDLDQETDPGRTGLAYPTATVVDLGSGTDVDLEGQLTGQDLVLMWFWDATGESAADAAAIATLAGDFDGRIDVVAIGTGGDQAQAEQFRQDTGLSGVTTVWDPAAESFEHYQVTTIPSVIVIDDAGDIVGRWTTLSPEVAEFLDIIA